VIVVVDPLMSRPSMLELLIDTSKLLCSASPVEIDSESDTVCNAVPELAGRACVRAPGPASA